MSDNFTKIREGVVPTSAVRTQKSRKNTMKTPKKEKPMVQAQAIPVVNNNLSSNKIDVSDCGFTPNWQYQCSPQTLVRVCIKNDDYGAWIPLPVSKNELYYECEAIKSLSNRKEFNSAFSQDF
jgi:hypothetical protein